MSRTISILRTQRFGPSSLGSFGRAFLMWENWALLLSHSDGEVNSMKFWHSSRLLPVLVQDCQ